MASRCSDGPPHTRSSRTNQGHGVDLAQARLHLAPLAFHAEKTQFPAELHRADATLPQSKFTVSFFIVSQAYLGFVGAHCVCFAPSSQYSQTVFAWVCGGQLCG